VKNNMTDLSTRHSIWVRFLARCNCKAGFTLLELMVVLFVVSLIMAIIMPSFAGLGASRLRAEAREMASILRYMNDSAASHKETFPIKFDLDQNKVSWKGPDGEKTRQFDDLTAIETQSMGMVSRGEVILSFEPLGVRDNVRVHMSRDDKNLIVTLNNLSGKVKIEDRDEG
jgi:general secretion pathway protein H